MAFRHAIHNVYKAGAEYVMPVRSQSGYKESGVCSVVLLDFAITLSLHHHGCRTILDERNGPILRAS